MKNIHVIKTDKASRLHKYDFDGFALSKEALNWKEAKNIYITSDEEIKEGDWCLLNNRLVVRYFKPPVESTSFKKIILTTDPDLIKDGVQAIDDNFLEWFVKNPSCEGVEVKKEMYMPQSNGKISDGKITHELSLNPLDNTFLFYKIIIPKDESKQEEWISPMQSFKTKEEPKQETLEEFIQRQLSLGKYQDQESAIKYSILAFAKWQQEQDKNKYSEEEVLDILFSMSVDNPNNITKWFEQFKNK